MSLLLLLLLLEYLLMDFVLIGKRNGQKVSLDWYGNEASEWIENPSKSNENLSMLP